jgi:glycosyltransferase involved in cell wall biosynthesis
MNKPLISLVTVCYNAENLLADTLQSAINRTYKNIELVIVDGNSKDNTLQVAKRFQSHIGTLISEPDKGIYDAMNKGIKAAKGDWIYFLNAGIHS